MLIGVYPECWPFIDKLVIPVNEDVYNYLVERFDDNHSSKCNLLLPCKQCLIDSQLLNQRRYFEKNEFKKHYENTKHIKETNMYYTIYALNVNWYKDWESFVQSKIKGTLFIF